MGKNIYTPTYYHVLELNPDATADEIKAAWRRLIKVYHEDKNPNNPQAKEKSQEINEAYEVLSDEKKRAEYDNGLNTYIKEGEERIRRHREAQKQSSRSTDKTFFNFAAVAVILFLIIGLFSLITDETKS
ncbi:MAG: J domain-containing protein [Sphingobacteriaceae bacterium]|jgi:curved DNA-binding protein CbpA